MAQTIETSKQTPPIGYETIYFRRGESFWNAQGFFDASSGRRIQGKELCALLMSVPENQNYRYFCLGSRRKLTLRLVIEGSARQSAYSFALTDYRAKATEFC